MSLINRTSVDKTIPVLVETNEAPGGFQLVNPYRTNRAETNDLVLLAQEIQKADSFTKANVSNKLQIIAEQVRFLQEQARKVLKEAHENNDLHHVPCNFVKKPGQIYCLYCRPSGQKYFSMLSPQEWGSSCPHEYLGRFRLEHDHSWTPEKDLEKRENDFAMIDKILTTSSSHNLSIKLD